MGSSGVPNRNSNSNSIDASVGALVWVRRRNGSWWPGQIMSLDEFSSDSLVSPAAGTPVKLLGRQDPSVDWYNLEKSKRVKAFRCGEYDECIEKAKVSAANGNRKKVRYARREDAILHALEIEKARFGKVSLDLSRHDDCSDEHGITVEATFRMSISGREDLALTNEKQGSGGYRDGSDLVSASGSGANSDSDANIDTAPQLSESGLSFEVPNHIGTFKVLSADGKSRRTPNDSEDDGTGGIKRMRGLEDLGIGVRDPKTGSCISNGALANGSKVCTSSLKRKRTQIGHVPELLKRKSRRRQLTKVLESTAMVSVPLFPDQLSPYQATSDSKFSGVESNESRKGSNGVINNNSDSTGISCENGSSLNIPEHVYDAPHVNYQANKDNGVSGQLGPTENDSSDKLFDVPFVAEEKNSEDASSLPGSTSELHNQAGAVGRQSQAEAAPEALKESGNVNSAEAFGNGTGQRIEKGTSKWQSKGKRNLRRKGKSKRRDLRKYTDLNRKAPSRLENKRRFNGLRSGLNQNVDSDGVGCIHASCDCNLQVNSRTFACELADGVRDCSNSLPLRESHIGGPAGEVSSASQSHRSLPYRQSRFTVNSRYQSSYFLGRNFSSHSKLYDVKLEVNANYPPPHVPLLSLTSNLHSKAIVGHPITVAVLDDGYCDHMICRNKRDATWVTAQRTTNWPSTAMQNSEAGRGRGSSKMKKVHSRSKSSKHRKNALFSKKIRKLSSLTGNRECHQKTVAEKPMESVIACIPVKLVFSRINEALNRPARQPHRPSASANLID